MDYSAVALYVVAVVAYTASPGPLMAVLVSRTVGRDAKGAIALALGFCIADVIAVLAVAYGIGVWAASRPDLLSLGRYLGVAYLLWLAIGMWNGGSATVSSDQQKTGWFASVSAGVAICLGNPATLLVYMILLPIIAPAGFVNGGQIAFASAVTFVGAGIVFFGTVFLARQLNGIIASPSSTKLFGRITAATLALTSVWMLTA
jgi:threonine/homoserine/homoserine lactone efflux protein